MSGGAESWRVSLLDIGSIVTGAAIAAVHVRMAVPTPVGLPAWTWAAVLLAWLTVTAAGPFFYLSRRWRAGPTAIYPQTGDRLWVLWGCPWVAAAVVAAAPHRVSAPAGQLDAVYVGSLGLGLFLATMIAVPILATRYVWGGTPASRRGVGANWTQWVGLALTATWPLQCGVGLVLMG